MMIRAIDQALEALEAGPNAYLLMNTGGIIQNLRQVRKLLDKPKPVMPHCAGDLMPKTLVYTANQVDEMLSASKTLPELQISNP